MGNVNTVVISGNLTRDPENFGTTTPVVKFGIACNRQYKAKDATEYTEEVSFFDVTVFGNFGDLVARKLKKGDSATVHGRLKQETWETEEGKRSKVGIIADQIDCDGFFRSKDEDNDQAAKAEATPAAEASTATPAADGPAPDDDIPF